MTDFKETCIDYLDVEDYATFCSSERKWINKINKLHESHPDDVQIVFTPEENNGVIYAHVPKTWLRLSPPKKMNFTEEQRAAAAERMRQAREGK